MIITLEASAEERRSAKAPHELFTVNTVIVHLFFSLAMIKLFNMGMNLAIGSSIALSFFIIVYTFFRTKKSKQDDPYLVYLHWQLSLNRYKLLIGAYVFYFLVNSLSLVITTDAPASMDGSNIMDSILSLLGVVPLFFAVLISVVLGSGSMFNAGRGEVDEKLSQKYPQA
jgi:hypothetical protein